MSPSNNKGYVHIFDWIVIWILVTSGMSVIQIYTHEMFSTNRDYTLLAFALPFHFLRFGVKFPLLTVISKTPILLLFFCIYFMDWLQILMIQGLTLGSGLSGATLRPIGMFLLMSYLYNMYREARKSNQEGLTSILRPMIGYSIYNIFVVVVMFLLIAVGFSWQVNEVGDALLFGGHKEWNLPQYFPYYLCVVADYHHGLFPIPTLMGLSHEPHVLMFMTTPAFIFLFVMKNKWKYLMFIPFVFMLGETASTMAILAFGVIVILELLWSGEKKMLLIAVFFIILSGYLYQIFGDYLELIQSQIEHKTSGGDDSKETSLRMLQYLFSFSNLFGMGNNPNDYGFYLKGRSAGIITTSLDLLLYISMAWTAVKAFLRRERNIHYWGLGLLYFLIHGTKISYMLFSYPYFAFFVLMTALLQKRLYAKKKK